MTTIPDKGFELLAPLLMFPTCLDTEMHRAILWSPVCADRPARRYEFRRSSAPRIGNDLIARPMNHTGIGTYILPV